MYFYYAVLMMTAFQGLDKRPSCFAAWQTSNSRQNLQQLKVLMYLLALKAEARSYCMMVTTWSRSVWYLDILSGDV
jgi:hypothetical protein